MERQGSKLEKIKIIIRVVEYGLLAVAVLNLGRSAFSYESKQDIIDRDGYECLRCGATDNLEAAHYNHSKKKPDYDDPENGRMLCTSCHLEDHVVNGKKNGLTGRQNDWAITQLLKKINSRQIKRKVSA